MPAFGDLLGQDAAWAIRTCIETRPDDRAMQDCSDELKSIREQAQGYADVGPDAEPAVPYFRFHDSAVETDSIADIYLTSFAGGQIAPRVRHYPRMTNAMAALTAGEVAMTPRSQLEWGARDGVTVHTPPLAGFAVSTWNLGVAVQFVYRPLA